jgi:hypothetical protein
MEMAAMRPISAGLIAAALLIAVDVSSQTPRNVDPTPLERPKPLCSLKGEAVRPIIQLVSDTLESAGYSITQVDFDRGELRASQSDGKGENRLVVWLEWDVLNPGKQMHLYLSAGRFEPFFGSIDLRRVQLAANEEQQLFAPIRKALIAAAAKG